MNAGSRNGGRSLGEVFRWPALLAAVTLVGLLAALLGDGWADVLSAACLGALLVVLAAAWWRR